MSTRTLSKTSHNTHNSKEKSIILQRADEFQQKFEFDDRPTPLDFDTFIPWICLEWEVPDMISVTRMIQEQNVKSGKRRSSSSKRRSIKSDKLKEGDELKPEQSSIIPSSCTIPHLNVYPEDTVSIKAYYDSQGHLAEIAIDSCVTALHRKVIKAINLCIPFHSYLTKLIIRKRGLNYMLIHDIGKLLPHSNLTDVCLDDTNVPEGNYYLLLNHASNLKYLSLNRCRINDNVCKEIASRIDYGCAAENSLAILSLSTNLITDVGAKYFGDILRRNRHLLHLNLMGNEITDTGFYFLIKHLQEFPMTCEEIEGRKQRSVEYYRKRYETYQSFVQELAYMHKSEVMSLKFKKSQSIYQLKKDKKSTHRLKHTGAKSARDLTGSVPSRVDIAEMKTKEIFGEFIDIFDKDNCVVKENHYYSIGNFKLCSLNVAYNNLEFLSLLKLLDILKYQSTINKQPSQTGLLRVVLEGNYFPNSCPELEQIDTYLKKAISSQVPLLPVVKKQKQRNKQF